MAEHGDIEALDPERISEIICADSFAEHMGAVVEEIRPGYARTRMDIDKRHLNFLNMVHGGALFALADITFGAAANSFGTKAMAVHVGIDYLAATGDSPYLIGEVELVGRAGKIGNYKMRITNPQGELIATCSGWAYHTGRSLEHS
jgi:acyl-CoA thioesterase